jgi:hypothetical protein
MPRPAPRPAWPALLFALVLTACAQPAPPPARPALALTRDLLACRERPPVPNLVQDADVMLWILDLDERGEDCAQRLARVREVLGREVVGPVDRE